MLRGRGAARRRRRVDQGERLEAQGGRRLIELRTFRLRDGADEETFLAADARFQQEVAYRQEGFVRRTTARGADGDWLVVTLWWSAEYADRAPASSADLDAVVDPSSIAVRRYEELGG